MRVGVGLPDPHFVTTENIKKFSDLPPHNKWLTGFVKMIDFIKTSPINIMVEIGSWQGESTAIFAFYLNLTKIYAVEPFIQNYDPNLFVAQQPMDIAEGNFKEQIERFSNIEHLRMTSEQALLKFECQSVDFVYIDGDHRYEFVKQDILGWVPKLKPKCYIGGHDLGQVGVKSAVAEVLGKIDISFEDGSWLKRI